MGADSDGKYMKTSLSNAGVRTALGMISVICALGVGLAAWFLTQDIIGVLDKVVFSW